MTPDQIYILLTRSPSKTLILQREASSPSEIQSLRMQLRRIHARVTNEKFKFFAEALEPEEVRVSKDKDGRVEITLRPPKQLQWSIVSDPSEDSDAPV